MNYTNDQLKHLAQNGIEDSAVKVILLQLLENQPSRARRWMHSKHPDNLELDQIEPNDVRTGYLNGINFVTQAFQGGDPEEDSTWKTFETIKITKI